MAQFDTVHVSVLVLKLDCHRGEGSEMDVSRED